MNQVLSQLQNNKYMAYGCQGLRLLNRFGKINLLFFGVAGAMTVEQFFRPQPKFWRWRFIQEKKPTRSVFEQKK